MLVSLPVDGGTADRLSRVGALRPILSGVSESAPADVDAAVAELFALADDEIVENLGAGGPFASTGFIQERLDAFMAAWGGAGFRVHGLGPEGTAGSLTLGVFSLPGPAPRGSVRVLSKLCSMNAWCSVNRPVSASRSWASFSRSCPRARPARCSASRRPQWHQCGVPEAPTSIS